MTPNDKLTPQGHFRAWEFFVTQESSYQPDARGFSQRLYDEANPEVRANIIALANQMEVVRAYLGGKSLIITSGFRSPELNRLVGGVSKSKHLSGRAADFVVKGLENRQVQQALEDWWSGGLGSYNSFTHLDLREQRARF